MGRQCIQCQKGFNKRSKALECEKCKEKCHIRCGINITVEQYQLVKENKFSFPWTCDNCKEDKKRPQDHETNTDHQPAPTKRRRLLGRAPSPPPSFTTSADHRTEAPSSPTPVRQLNTTYTVAIGSPDASIPRIPDSLEFPEIPNRTKLTPNQSTDKEPIVPIIMDDIPIGDMPPLTFTIVPGATKKGKDRLVSSHNHVYNFKRTLKKTGATVWQCSVRNKMIYCTAVVTQLGGVFTPGLAPHLCIPKPSALPAAKIQAQIRDQALRKTSATASAIVKEALREHLIPGAPTDSVAQLSSLISQTNNIRRRNRQEKAASKEATNQKSSTTN